MCIVANVYVYYTEEWLLQGSLLPCYKILKNGKFSKRLETASVEFDLQNSVLFKPISFKGKWVRFRTFSCDEANERQFSLAQYIRLEFNYTTTVTILDIVDTQLQAYKTNLHFSLCVLKVKNQYQISI